MLVVVQVRTHWSLHRHERCTASPSWRRGRSVDVHAGAVHLAIGGRGSGASAPRPETHIRLQRRDRDTIRG